MALSTLFILLAAASSQPAALAPTPPAPTRRWGRQFISPMGEPFRDDARGDALAVWFDQADRNHDGYLTVEEMQADADRFFATLDTNHDGEIDPDEMTRYETVIAPQVYGGPPVELAGQPSDVEDPAGRPRGHNRRRESPMHEGASQFGLLDLPEPVAAADADFNRGVSQAEFRQAALQRFAALDLDHKGRLTLAGLELIRPAPSPEAPKPTDPTADYDPGTQLEL